MKFSIKMVNAKGCRLGMLSSLKSNPEVIYETPLSLFITKYGTVPHLTKDINHSSFSKKSLVCIPVQHFASCLDVLQAYEKGVASFCSISTHPVCAVVQDPSENSRSGFNDRSAVSVWDTTGRIKLTSEKYMNLVASMLPDWYETLNDADTSLDASRKRIEKSLNNSFEFLNYCHNVHHSKEEFKGIGIFAPLLGGLNPCERSRWSKRINEIEVDGFTLLGIHQNGDSAEKMVVEDIRKCIMASLEAVPVDKVRQAQGAFSVIAILEMVECGVDIFDSSSAYLASERGRAFCFPSNLRDEMKRCSHGNAESSAVEDQVVTKSSSLKKTSQPTTNSLTAQSEVTIKKKFKSSHLVDGESCFSNCNNPSEFETDERSLENPEQMLFQINLKDKKYISCKEPLVDGCQCYTCQTFTTAYVHHLLSVREMLGSVLLMIHNLHQWNFLFEEIREAIRGNKYEALKSFFINYKTGKNS